MNGFIDISETQSVELYYANNDLIFPSEINLPRFAAGSFKECLDLLFFKQFGRELKSTIYGKPSILTFQYAQK